MAAVGKKKYSYFNFRSTSNLLTHVSIDDELILPERLQVGWCGRLPKEQLRLHNQQKVVEQKHNNILGPTNLETIKK